MRTRVLALCSLFVLAGACGGSASPDATPDTLSDAATDLFTPGDVPADNPGSDATDVARDAPQDVTVDAPPVCGNGRVEGTEACDDGNSTQGDGCNNNCTFSCTAAADCDDMNACNGAETCTAATHRCAAGTNAADNTTCGTGGLCRSGACVPARCGDGLVTAPEACDDGNRVNGDGCDNSCQFTCTTDTQCSDLNLCNGNEVCDRAAHRCMLMVAMPPDGTICGAAGAGQVCRAGLCGPSTCGNTTTDPGEDCDDGNTTNGDGCENNCRFTCVTDANCADGNVCNGAETCAVATHTCTRGTTPADGAACDADMNAATRDICRAGVCAQSNCGDGFVDMGRGETCELPAAGCDPATCTSPPAPACGNRVVDPGEQCDDGNRTRWDGCAPDCRLEQTVRADHIEFLGAGGGCDITGDGRIDNAIGAALSSVALDTLNTAIQTNVDMGGSIVLATFLDLDDPLGRNDTSMRLAFLAGTPTAGVFAGVRGERFTIPAASLDATGLPMTALSPGAIMATSLTAGPGTTILTVNLGSDTPQPLPLYRGTISATVTPDTAMNRIDGITNGRLCGAVSAADLDRIPAPMGVPVGCLAAAPLSTSLLDVIVSGCHVFNLVISTQPDVDTAGMPLPAAMIPLADTNNDHLVDTCRTPAGVTITGNDCAQDPRFLGAYSSAIRVSAIRVLISGTR